MSLVETFQMPLREIRDKFTWSEIVLMGWRSKEQSVQLKRKQPSDVKSYREARTGKGKRRKQYASNELIPTNLPDRFFNEEGEVDLRLVKGRDAVQYLAHLGIHVPVGGGISRS